MARIAIIPVSAKPVTRGHYHLIELASQECDSVMVFVSLSDRKRPGEFPVTGNTMARIWRELIMPMLPNNVSVTFAGSSSSPVRMAYEQMGKANEEGSGDTYVIYGDHNDLAKNFPEKSLSKYAANLFMNGQAILRAVSRDETGGVSGTRVRQFLASGDKQSFLANMPQQIDGERAWELLQHTDAVALVSEVVRLHVSR